MMGSGYDCNTGIYRSLRPPIHLPQHPHTDLVSFLFHNTIEVAGVDSKTALLDAPTGHALSYSELRHRVQRVAAGLGSLGVSKGQVVLILSPNSLNYPVIFLALISVGAVVTTANPAYTPRELYKQIRDSDVRLVCVVPELVEKVKHYGLPLILLEEFDPWSCQKSHNNSPVTDDHHSFSELLRADPLSWTKPQIQQTDTAVVLYSSGTTGASKGVVLSHRNIIAAALQMFVGTESVRAEHQVILCFLPLYHVFALLGVLCSYLHLGQTVVIMPKFEINLMLEAIQKYKVNLLPVVPPICIALAKQKAVETYDLSSLKEIVSGAAPLREEIMEQCYLKLPDVPINQGYGLTETTAVVSFLRGHQAKKDSSSVGLLCSSMEAKVVDVETEKLLPPVEKAGELWFRGPNIMQGYLNNPMATTSTLDNEGWLHTGDLGYFDEKGMLFVVDRLKELIKYKGLQVAPAELEDLLLSHPCILDAAVVPFPDDDAGQIPHAFVVRSPEKQLSEEEIIQFVAEQVAPFKRVRKVTFVGSIPKSPSGKILRRQLTQLQLTAKL